MADIGNRTVFATGPAGTSGLDSLTFGGGSLWAEYGNGAKSDGTAGSSTIVQYDLSGAIQNTYTIAGSVDGLKIDPATGTVFALQNQDGNSTLTLIDPATGKTTGPLSYTVASTTRGYDDVAFTNGQVYLSYTNPNGAGDAVVQRLDNGDQPFGTLTISDILPDGATGTDISTGLTNQPIPLSDPDSLKSTPNGGLMLSSEEDNTIVFIDNPGATNQSERFVTLKNLPPSSLDDALMPSSTAGTFYVSNLGTNQIETIKVSGLNTSDAYASVGTEIVKVDLQTGATTPIVTGLSKSHGLIFVPDAVDNPVVQSTKIFAVGSEANGTKPDSITLAGDNVFVEYGNGADATGKPNGGSSTIVEYDKLGQILQTYTLPGSIDGLKYNPTTGQVWALENQDANSSLFIIDPVTQQVSAPLTYDSGYVYGAASTRGYDDVAFDGGKVYLSYTNPAATGDSVIQLLDNGNNPVGTLKTTSILRLGDTGTNLATGQLNQPLPVSDPDSLKVLSDGSLILTSDKDASYTIITDPGTTQQSASFITLPAGSSGLDDAIIPTASSGTFLISNQNANDVLRVEVTGLNTNDIYASVGSENAIVQIDTKTGAVTPIISGLNSPHGLTFIASGSSTDSTTILPQQLA